jgi:DNA polymerase I-like protein with 3'-5' exonuclease and polymerase domains
MIWDDLKTVAFDFEASGELPEHALQPWRLDQGKFWATSISVIQHTGTSLTPFMSKLFPTVEDMRIFLEAAVANDWLVVTWNGIYDIAILIAYGLRDLVYKTRWIDGMLLWRHLYIEPEYDETRAHKKSYKLKPDAVREFIPLFADDTGADEVDFHTRDPEQLAKLQHYNNRDSVRTQVITRIIWDRLTPAQRNAALIEAECLPMVAEANLHGMPIDTIVTRELAAWLQGTAAQKLEELAPHGVSEVVVRSPLKLAKLLFDDWGLPVLKENVGKKTGKTSRSTDKEVLHELAFTDPRAKQLRDYREALNNETKFAQAPLVSAEYNGDGRTRPSAFVFGTYSGRMTYASKQGKNKDERQTGFALHQEKRGKEFRAIVQAPPGYTLLEFDASGQEFRWMAVKSGDPNMLQLCLPGEDPHAFMGGRVAGKDYRFIQIESKNAGSQEEQDRYLGKVANLCIAEGTTILTDRGPCNIEHIRDDDLVWDGASFVAHDGVSFSGVNEVITYMGVTATLDHKVLLTNGRWEEIEAAARHGWAIEPALGQGWSNRTRSAVRIVDGLVRRTVREVRGSLRVRALRLWEGARCQLTIHGGRSLHAVQRLCDHSEAPSRWGVDLQDTARQTSTGQGQRVVPAVSQSEGQVVSQLRRAWDRVQVRIHSRWCRVHQDAFTAPGLHEAGYRSNQQRRSLRAWKLALGYARGEPSQSRQVRTYDIVNCGPNTRFAANGLIVHNSLQYRTYPKTFCRVARVDYNIPLELPAAQRIHRTYQQTYTEVPKYWDRAIQLVKQLGFAETLAGRRVQVKGDWEGKFGWRMESTALNYPIQGTGAEQKYLALKIMKDLMIPERCYFAFDMHDGLYWWVPDAIVDRIAAQGRQLLNTLPYQEAWGFTPPIPMPWDAKLGKGWGSLQEFKG